MEWFEDDMVVHDYKLIADSNAPVRVREKEYVTMEFPNKSYGAFRTLWTHFVCTILDIYAAVVIFWHHLVTFETFLVSCVAIGATLFYFELQGPDASDFGGELSWVLVSFAVVSPMIMQIKQAFVRRETSLHILAELKSIMMNIMLANSVWNWSSGNGRDKLPENHSKKTHVLLSGIISDLTNLLKLPTFNRGRHRFTRRGTREASDLGPYIETLNRRIVFTVKQLHRQTEVMKVNGLPANEASRVNQYNWFLLARIERLLNFKYYRTPQATRSFTRVFILLLPMFYGPYYVHIGKGILGPEGVVSEATNIYFAVALSFMTSLVMIGIFNVERALEDPFTEDGLDDVHVTQLCRRLQDAVNIAASQDTIDDHGNDFIRFQS